MWLLSALGFKYHSDISHQIVSVYRTILVLYRAVERLFLITLIGESIILFAR